MSRSEQMRMSDDKPRSGRRAMLGALTAALLCLGLLIAVPAQGAALEQVAHFGGILEVPTPPGDFPEEEQLGGAGGMAVNYTGAGEVQPGTVYVATKDVGEPTRIAVFKPAAGGLTFSFGWEVKQTEGAYERCGPDLLPESACPIRVESLAGYVDVEVDQSTGNVYVKTETVEDGLATVAVFTPKGEEVLARFGEIGASGQTTAASPDKVHASLQPGGIAVNEEGEVYLYDRNSFDNNYERLMKFVPSVPGVYDDYEYAGVAADVAAGEETEPTRPVADAAGNLYVTPISGSRIKMYDPDNPGDPPVCEFKPAKGGVSALTVNPLNGEVFFFSYRKEAGFAFKTIHQLAPCNPATGKFGEDKVIGQVEVTPERDDLSAMAFDPVRELSPTRPAGVLYGAAPSPVPSSGFGQGEPGRGSLGYIYAPKEESPPEVEEQSVSKVTAKSAQLHALIAPNGFKTRYVFQYLTEAAYQIAGETFTGASEAPLGEAFLDGTGEPQSVGVTLVGLAPDTAYRFRAVATSNCAPEEAEKVCEDAGDAQSFRTYPVESGELPDNRAYELVSPADKNGGQVFPMDPRIFSCAAGCQSKPGATYEHFPMQSTPEGNAVAYEGFSFTPGAGVPRANEYVARRGSTGWSSTQLSSTGGGGYRALDPALSKAALQQGAPTLSPEAPPDYANVYAQSAEDPLAIEPLVASEPPNRPSSNFQINFAGAADDLSRIFFAANDALSEETSVAPEAEDGGPSKFNLYEWERASGQLRLVNVLPGNTETEVGAAFGTGGSANAISADGSRAFWTDEAGQLYVREGTVETREIPDSGKFLSASADGSKLLLDNGHLYDVEADETTDLTEGKGGFLGLVGQSDDLSRIYFVDTAVLSEDENSEGDKAVAGQPNLYAWEGVTSTFVATLVAGDNGGGSNELSHSWSTAPSSRTAQASPSGRFLAFLSQAPLTGYDNTGPCESDHAGGLVDAPCPEAYLYDSATGELHCASCNPSGARPLGSSVLRLIAGASVIPQPRYLTDTGRLYFDSQDSLSPFDTNEGVEDVYEFEPQGIGECTREGGCVALLSAGREEVDSNLLAVDASGKNVFFTSRDRLVSADKDELLDVYDVREGGGFAEEIPQGPCQGSDCQPTSPAAPEAPPSSATLTDPGNVKPAKPCKKGQVKKKGKCVKKKQKKHKPSSKSKKHKRGGAK